MGGDSRPASTATTPEPVGWIEARSSRLHGHPVGAARRARPDRRGARAGRGRRATREGTFTRARAPPSCASRRATASRRSRRGSAGWAPRSRSGPTASRSDGGRPLRGAAVALARRPSHRDGARGGGPRGRGRDRDRGRRAASPSPSRSSTTSWRSATARVEPRPARVVLVGFMGAGKSTVGPRRWPALLGWAFVDLDRWIEERHGLTRAPRSSDADGEAAFREEERRGSRLRRAPRPPRRGGRRRRLRLSRRRATSLRPGALTVWLRCDLAAALAPHAGRTAVDRWRRIVRQCGDCSPSGSPPTAWPTGRSTRRGGRPEVAGAAGVDGRHEAVARAADASER